MMSFLSGGGSSSSGMDAENEEEMIRLASEISLMDDFDMEFDPCRLDILVDKLRLYEEIVDQHLTTADNICVDGFGEPISDAQIKDIFGIDIAATPPAVVNTTAANNPNINNTVSVAADDDINATNAVAAAISNAIDEDAADSDSDAGQCDDISLGGMESRGPRSRSVSAVTAVTEALRRCSEGPDGSNSNSNSKSHIQNLVTTIGAKLRWYQKKIVNQVPRTDQGEELKLLLELSDKAASILTKVDLIVEAEFPTDASSPPAANHSQQQQQRQKSAFLSAADRGSSNSKETLASGATLTASAAADGLPLQRDNNSSNNSNNINAATEPSNASVVSAVFALRRSRSREENLQAVNHLIELCHFGGEISRIAAKAMMSAGALHTLLSTLTRSNEWPEVEQQVSKLVSVLIVFEDDWVLLQRSALLILSSLYSLRLKTAQQHQQQMQQLQQQQQQNQQMNQMYSNNSGYVSGNSSARTPVQHGANRSRTTSLSTTTTAAAAMCGITNNATAVATPTLRDVNLILRSGRMESNQEATKRLTRQEPNAATTAATTTAAGGVAAIVTASALEAHNSNSSGNSNNNSSSSGLMRGGDDDRWSLIDENENLGDVNFDEEEDIKTLLSAAITKLTLVLASEWGKLDSPISFAAENRQQLSSLNRQHTAAVGNTRDLMRISNSGGMLAGAAIHLSAANSSGGSSSGAAAGKMGTGSGILGSSTSTHRNSVKASSSDAENDRILQILLNMISNLCESSLEQERGQLSNSGSNSVANYSSSTTTAAAAAAKHSLRSNHSGSMQPSLAGLDVYDFALTSAQSSVMTAATDSVTQNTATNRRAVISSTRSKSHPSLDTTTPSNLLAAAAAAAVSNVAAVGNSTTAATVATTATAAAISGLPPLMMPVKEIPDIQLSDDEDNAQVASVGGLNLFAYSGLMKVDSAAVLCSAALANLAAVPQCRPGLVSYGALGMIKAWLEIGIEVLSQAKELCFERYSALAQYAAADGADSSASATTTDDDAAAVATNTTAAAATDTARGAQQTDSSSSQQQQQQQQQQQLPDSYTAFMELYGPAYELISNAAEALMYLSGGSDCRNNPAAAMGQGYNPAEPYSRNHDYIIGWIDAQILGEGLPGVLVKMLNVSVEPFTSLPPKNDLREPNRRSRSVLPAAVGMHVAQTLFQICSRPGNRQQLQLIDIPFYLCLLFENISNQINSITAGGNLLSPVGSPRHAGNSNTGSIFSYIFHFGGIYSENTPPSIASSEVAQGRASTPSRMGPLPLLRESSSDFLALYSANVEERQHHRQNMGGTTPQHLRSARQTAEQRQKDAARAEAAAGNKRNNNSKSKGYGKAFSSSCGQGQPVPPPLFTKLLPEDLMPIMASITSSCLEALTCFFEDELAKMPYTVTLGSGKRMRSQQQDEQVPALSTAGLLSARVPFGARTAYSMSGLTGHRVPLLDLMCSQRMIESILMACSFLPLGPGRMSTVRVISVLTDCPITLQALYDGAVMDALVHIASESEENKREESQLLPHHRSNMSSRKDSRSSKDQSSNSLKEDAVAAAAAAAGNSSSEGILAPSSLMASIFPPKPATVERGVSDASSVSAMSSSMTGTGAAGFSPRNAADHFDAAAAAAADADELDPIAERKRFIKAVALEETLTVCYALANLCEASAVYSLRMFHSGLYSIMLKIVRSKHIEVCRQALRSVEAMCAVITDEILERAMFTSPKGKNSLLLDSLEILTDLLNSPSAPVLRSSISIIAHIAAVNETLQDKVVDGPLRVVLYLLLDPEYDRDIRAAAIVVLQNLGFLGGAQDYELCGFDFEILRDWYIMKRSLKPQEMAHDILVEWMHKLFDEQLGSSSNGLHHPTNDSGSDAHAIFHEAAHILQGSVSMGDLPSMVGSDHGVKGTPSLANLLSSAAGVRGSGLSIPTLQRNITDGLLKLLPFCIKSPFHEARRSSSTGGGSSDFWDRSSHANPGMNISGHSHNSPMTAAGGGSHHGHHAPMNRSTHGSSSNMTSPVVHQSDYNWLDRPPLGVLHLLDLFYTSKLQQLLLLDLTSLGVAISTQYDAIGDDHTEDFCDSDVDDNLLDLDLTYIVPKPHPISAIIMPSRIYPSFRRVGRVIEKMIAYFSPLKMWSLTFRDCEFMGNFHTSLLTTLRQCPQICSLAFASSQRVEEDALMGHLVGQIPASVRFLSFKSTLSRESIQALCILLRTHNAAFKANEVDSISVGSSTAPGAGFGGRSSSNRRSNSANSSHGKVFSAEASTPMLTKGTKEAGDNAVAVNVNLYNARGVAQKGLLGLALTHLTFEASEISCIVELLHCIPRASMSRHQSFKERNSDAASSAHNNSSSSLKQSSVHPSTPASIGSNASGGSSMDHSHHPTSNTPHSAKSATFTSPLERQHSAGTGTPGHFNASSVPGTPRASQHFPPAEAACGLRYLDLSFNALSDQTCARLLLAATHGPLEGLELAGNPLQRCTKLVEAMEVFSADHMIDHRHRLRHLGLSHCALTSRSVGALMDQLLDNVTLTSLDLSHNEIDHSAPSNDMVRHFLRTNCGLRALDLCFNRLNVDSYKELHLGLLENECLLLMPLAGNSGIERNPTIQLIQMKLRENRLCYKAQCGTEELLVPETIVAFAAEELDGNITADTAVAAAAVTTDVAAVNQRSGRRFDQPMGAQEALVGTAASTPFVAAEAVVKLPVTAMTAASVFDSASNDRQINSGQRFPLQLQDPENLRPSVDSLDTSQRDIKTASTASSITHDASPSVVSTGVASVRSAPRGAASATAVASADRGRPPLSGDREQLHREQWTAEDGTMMEQAHSDEAVAPVSGVESTQQHQQQRVVSADLLALQEPQSGGTSTGGSGKYYALGEDERASTMSLDALSVRLKQRKNLGQSPAVPSAATAATGDSRGSRPLPSVPDDTEAEEVMSAAPIMAPITTQLMSTVASTTKAATSNNAVAAAADSIPATVTSASRSSRPMSTSALSLRSATAASSSSSSAAASALQPESPGIGGKFANNTLNVLFSAPLVGFDRASNPHALEVLDYSSERDILVQVFKEVHRDISVHFDFATTDALRTALSLGCKALHFSGHGIPKGLCFEDGRSGLQVIRVPQLKDLLGAGGLSLQFVFVSACYSMEVGEAFVRAGVPHVVCVKLDSRVQDKAAIAFTRAFYVAFLSGRTVQSSFNIAKEALKTSPYVPDRLLEGEKFLLLPDYNSPAAATAPEAVAVPAATAVTSASGGAAWRIATVAGDHQKVLFRGRPIAKWPVAGKHCTMGANRIDVQRFVAQNRLPAPPPEFEGREVAMHSLVRSILERRLVSLVGDDGIGKTSVAAATCKILTDRECFPEAVVFVKCEGITNYNSFLRTFEQALMNTGSQYLTSRMQELHLSFQQQQAAVMLNQQQPMYSSAGGSGKMTPSATATTAGGAAASSSPSVATVAATVHSSTSNVLYSEEDVVFACLGDRKLLVVLDNLHDLLADFGESHTDLRIFLNRLFDLCPNVKLLVVSTDTLSMCNITMGFNVVEYSVPLGPLSLFSSLRLFTRLAPSLYSPQAKKEFINALLPPRQRHVTVDSVDASPAAKLILDMFGKGHPKKIVHMASVSNSVNVEQMKQVGLRILARGSSVQQPQQHQQQQQQQQQQSSLYAPSQSSVWTNNSFSSIG